MNPERHYQERIAQFAAEAVEPGAVVMLGSSHVERFDAALLPDWRIVNRGIAADRLDATGRGVLHRLEVSVFACRPSAIIFESGANDLGELWRFGHPSMDEIAAAYERVLGAIRARLPDTPMLLIEVFPTADAYAGMSGFAAQFNGRLPALAARHFCVLLRTFATLSDEAGQLRPELTEDGLHLSPAGYGLWAEALRCWRRT